LEIASWYLRLRGRVKRYKVLPDAGGVLDQDDETMMILDAVEDAIGGFEKVKQEQKEREAKEGAR